MAAFYGAHRIRNPTPGWVREAYVKSAACADVSAAMHYDENRYWVRGAGESNDVHDFHSIVRASAKYVATAGGILIPANSNRIARSDLGMPPEEARTNLALRSQTFANATWGKSQINEAASAVNAPDGTATASTITPTAGGSVHDLFQALSAVSGAYSESVWMRAGTSNFGFINLQNGANYLTVIVNLATGAVTQTAAAGTASLTSSSITAYTNGWYRVNLTGSLGAAVAYICVGVAGAATGNTFNAGGEVVFGSAAGTENIHLWGFQLELGAFPTSYIPTTTASATRAADVIAGAAAINAAIITTNGSAVAQVKGLPAATNTSVIVGTNSPSAPLYAIAPTGAGATYNGTTVLATAVGATWVNTNKTATSWGASSRSVVLNGGTVATDANAIDRLHTAQIGSNSNGNYLNGYLQRLTLFPATLSNAQLQSLTT